MGARKAAVVFALLLVPFADGAPALNGYLQHQRFARDESRQFRHLYCQRRKCGILLSDIGF
jgi:hypothetical protein